MSVVHTSDNISSKEIFLTIKISSFHFIFKLGDFATESNYLLCSVKVVYLWASISLREV